MPLFEIEYVKHILDEAKYITKNSKDLKFDKFRNDETLTRAFVRSIEIIGEASKKVSSEFKSRHTKIDWRSMTAMRDKLIHDYFGIDYEIVWDVIINEIPGLLIEINNIIDNEESTK
jgi:uncharacterized protein with HEPN domain